jgi:tetratricopeptide (TPR) repeat protein
MAIKGSLNEASLADVCQLLALGFKSGCLSVADGSRFGQIYFDRGRITYARIVNRRDRLGHLLARDGMLTQAQLEEVIVLQAREPDRRLGELLVLGGIITRADLGRYVRIQIEEAIYHLFTWSKGNFYFEVDEKPDADILVSINPESLMLEAARRVDEWSVIEKKIPSLDLIFEVERARLVAAEVELTSVQGALVPLCDGTRTVEQIVDATGLSEFDVGRGLFGLIQGGYAHRVGRRSAAHSPGLDVALQERRNLGVAYFRTGLLEDAARAFEHVLRLDATDLNARFHLALIALRMGRLRDAVRQLRMLLEKSGPHYRAFVNLAIALRELGRLDDALLVLAEAEALRPGQPSAALVRGVTLLRARSVSLARAALAEYRARLGAAPATMEYYYHAALAAALEWDMDGASDVLKEGIERYADAAPLLLLYGMIHEQSSDLDGAERLYQRAAHEDDSLPHVHKAMGDVAYRRGAHDEALAAYERVIQLDPEFSDDVYARMGNLHYRRQRIEAAVAYWKHALQLNPENTVVSNNIGIAAHVS